MRSTVDRFAFLLIFYFSFFNPVNINYCIYLIIFVKISISGIRGIFGDDLSIQEIARFSRVYGSYLKNNYDMQTCVIARDSRPSGGIITDIVIGCLLEQGINVYDLGIAPTPVLFRESRKYSGALMITASHNPLDMEWIEDAYKRKRII